MSRQFNPAITVYNRLSRELQKKPTKSETRTGGLLGPREDKVKRDMSEDINQPITRVKEHVLAIQKYKANRNA
jgi:hypothetical protein